MASSHAARRVTVLMRPDCENGPRAVERIRQLAKRLGIAVGVETVVIASEAQARDERFPGSPTIRVAGRDVDSRGRGHDSYAMT